MGCLSDHSQLIFDEPIIIKYSGNKYDGIDLYKYESDKEYQKFIFPGPYFICPLCNQRFSKSEMKELEKIRLHDYYTTVHNYISIINSSKIDIFEELEKYAIKIEYEKKIFENPYYKHKCIPNNTEYYIKLYNYPYPDLKKSLKRLNLDERYHYDIWRKDSRIKEALYSIRYKDLHYDYNQMIDDIARQKKEEKSEISSGYFRGKKLYGRVKVVDHSPDFNVKVVDSFPDLRVTKVENFPDDIGRWQFVDNYPDFTIRYVDSFPDFTIKFC